MENSKRNVQVNFTISMGEATLTKARKRAEAMGKSLNELISEYLESLTSAGNVENSIREFRQLSGQGDSAGFRFNRDEIHNRR